jgi:hypothetical protein
MNNQPNILLDKFLQSINQPKLTEEQKKAKVEAQIKYNRALNSIYNTEYGKLVIENLVAYCKWDSINNYKPEDRESVIIQQEMVRAMILSRLTAENLTKLLHSVRKGGK